MRFRGLVVLAVAGVMLFSFSVAMAGQLTFLLSPKSLNNPYWFAVENGMNAAAKKLGVKAIFDAPIQADALQQAQKIEAYIVKGVNGIGISPNDPQAIKLVVQKALKKGIPVITFDSDAPASGRYVYIGTNNYNGGYECGKLMAKFIAKYKKNKSTIKLAILTGGLAALNLNQRIKGFKDALAKYVKGKKVVFVADPFPCNDDTAKSVQIMKDVSKRYSDLDGWFMSGGWPLFAPKNTVVSALGGMKRVKNLLVVGFDTLPPELKLVEAGVVKGLVGQRPYDMGYLSIVVLYDMAKVGVKNTLKLLPKVVVNGKTDYIIDSGVDVVTQENVKGFMAKAEKIYAKNR